MKTIRVYRHPDCERCKKYASFHHRMDWLNRLDSTSETPPTGPLRVGEIAVENLATGEILKGIKCFRLICSQIPPYWPLLPLSYIPAIRRRIEHEISGCEDGACAIPARSA